MFILTTITIPYEIRTKIGRHTGVQYSYSEKHAIIQIKRKAVILMWGMIATWRMALEGVEKASALLKENGSCGDALEIAVKEVEDFPYYKSVGYGGLPNKEMEVELDAAYMDGTTLDFGAVAALRDFANPISIAKALSKEPVNNLLVGEGAITYAAAHGFERKNMLTKRAKHYYEKRLKELTQIAQPYDGHDTVGVISLDMHQHMCAGTSTSGLFMKHRGRVGDSPICGSGCYVDSEIGGAAATGLGEDLMKGCISYEIVRRMKEGMTPQQACETAVNELDERLRKQRGSAGDLSVVAMNAKGEWGCATNIETFSVVVCSEQQPLSVYRISRDSEGKLKRELADREWIDEYVAQRSKPLE